MINISWAFYADIRSNFYFLPIISDILYSMFSSDDQFNRTTLHSDMIYTSWCWYLMCMMEPDQVCLNTLPGTWKGVHRHWKSPWRNLRSCMMASAEKGYQTRDKPSKHKTFVLHLCNGGKTSQTLARRCTNVIQMFCVCWECWYIFWASVAYTNILWKYRVR